MDRLLVKTLLGRAKGYPLDITAGYYKSPIRDVRLFPPFARQIRSLEFKCVASDEAQNFSVVISGPVPLLRSTRKDTWAVLFPWSLPHFPSSKAPRT
jgi:hypothetical protein